MAVMLLAANAAHLGNLQCAWSQCKELEQIGYKPGLALTQEDGLAGLRSTAERQVECLRLVLGKEYSDAPIVIQVNPVPLASWNLCHQPLQTAHYVMSLIDFAATLPVDSRRIVMFRAYTFDDDGFVFRTWQQWDKAFSKILNYLRQLAAYANQRGVELAIETEPAAVLKNTFEGGHAYNRFPITNKFGFNEVGRTETGICLNLASNHTIWQTIRQEPDIWKAALTEYFVREHISSSLMNDVKAMSHTRGMVKLNDAICRWTANKGEFTVGLPLGDGEIKALPEVVRFLRQQDITGILDVSEKNPWSDERPATARSIQHLSQLLDNY